MDRGEKLALLLGMLAGDGCLTIGHNGEGYRDYPIRFYNTNKKLVKFFDNLFFELFLIKGNINHEDRLNRKRLWVFTKYSKEIYNNLKEIGFPEGRKRDILRIPRIIKYGTKKEKSLFFIGFLITDGCLRKRGDILFHSGSKLFLEDLSLLVGDFTNIIKPVKEYTQKDIYKSYQLSLNKSETKILLENVPLWDNGTPLALSSILRM